MHCPSGSHHVPVRGHAKYLWMDEILHRFETMGNTLLVGIPGEYQFLHFLGGAGFCPSTGVLFA